MAQGINRELAEKGTQLRSVASNPVNHTANIDAALHKANHAQVKLSQARGKAYAATRPVPMQDQAGRWTMMAHSEAEQHIKNAKKTTRKRVSAKK